jgi:flavodoxin
MATISFFVGSVYGGAEQLAHDLCQLVTENGHQGTVYHPGTVDDFKQAQAIVVVTSTTGQGDIPTELEAVYLALNSEFPLLTSKPFAVCTLGDSSYGDTFCGAGKKFSTLLAELQGNEVIERLEVDAMENFDPMPVAEPWIINFLSKL